MTEIKYLRIRGFHEDTWTILSKEDCEPYLSVAGHQNNMYSITEADAIKAFGKGSMIVKKEWMQKNLVNTPPSKPQTTSEDSKAVPPAPPKPPTPPVPPKPEAVSPPVVNTEKEEEVSAVEDKGHDFQCQQYDNTTIACEKQCKLCAKAEANGNTVEEQGAINQKENEATAEANKAEEVDEIQKEDLEAAAEKFDEIVEENKKDDKKKEADKSDEKKSEPKKSDSKPKTEKEKVKTSVHKVYPAPEDFEIELIEKLAKIFNTTKDIMFIITQVKGEVNSNNSNADKIARIKELTNNF